MAGEDAIFAPTPPLESLRMVMSYAVTDFPNEPQKVFDLASPERSQVLLVDILRAYFNAATPEDEPTYVELPPEFGAPPGTCVLLKRHMYGTRRAADAGRVNIPACSKQWDLTRGRLLFVCVCFDTKKSTLLCRSTATTSRRPVRSRPSTGLRQR